MNRVIAATRSPACQRAFGPAASTKPASSSPATYGHPPVTSAARPPERKSVSDGFTVAAATRIRISPSPGSGAGRSTSPRTSGPPYRVKPTARTETVRVLERARQSDALRDDVAHHLVRHRADLVQADITPVALHLVLGGVAHPSLDLDPSV